MEVSTSSPPASKDNCLNVLNPQLAKEWHSVRNGVLTPSDVTVSSGRKVWWRCKRGHEWNARIYSRNYGVGCPYCSGRKSIKGENDLQTVNPILTEEWNFIKKDISPDEIGQW